MDKRIQANLRVKKSITDALFRLISEKPLSEITVSEIVRTAGVAHASFYRNYRSKEHVITLFISDILQRFLNGRDPTKINLTSRIYVKKAFFYFKKYRAYFLNLYNANSIYVALEELNRVQALSVEHLPPDSPERYGLYFFMGALLNVATEWIKSGARESVDEMTDIFCSLLKI